MNFGGWKLDSMKLLLVLATNAMLGIGGNQGIRAGVKTLREKWQASIAAVSNEKTITNLKTQKKRASPCNLQVASCKSQSTQSRATGSLGYWVQTEDRNQKGDPERRHFSAITRDQIRMTFLSAVCYRVRRS